MPEYPKHHWCCDRCGRDVVSDERPDPCPEHDQVRMVDLGWSVGASPTVYSWYTTEEAAWKDKRCPKGTE